MSTRLIECGSNVATAWTLIDEWSQGPLVFAERRQSKHGQWTKHDGSGLKGPVAHWCKQHFNGEDYSSETPLEVLRIPTPTSEQFWQTVQPFELDAVVFATGFEPNSALPIAATLNGKPMDLWDEYRRVFESRKASDRAASVLAPGLYGVGIAFPEKWTDPNGMVEKRVGFGLNFANHVEALIHNDI